MNKRIGKKFVIFWSFYKGEPKVYRIELSKGCRLFPQAKAVSNPKIEILAKQIESYLKGNKEKFALETLHFGLCSGFQKEVLRMTSRIPFGKLSSYKLIAGRLGKPKAARAVGTALAGNPFPIVIPCHRVIRSDAGLGGYQGGIKMKTELIKREERWLMSKCLN